MLTRRQLLVTLPALGTTVAAPFRAVLEGQVERTPIRVRSLNHFEIAVADPTRTIDFYQGLFGMPVQARVGTTTVLRVGLGPQFLSIRPIEGNAVVGARGAARLPNGSFVILGTPLIFPIVFASARMLVREHESIFPHTHGLLFLS